MAVQVPKLRSLQGQVKSTKGTRINIQARSNADLIQANTQALTNVVKDGINLQQRYETKKVDQKTSEMEQDYTPWLNAQLARVKTIQGDPTAAYVELDKIEEERVNKYFSSQEGLSEDVKERLKSNMNAIRSKSRLSVLKQRGYQQEIYSNKLYEADLSLKRTSLPDTAGYIRAGDNSTFLMFDKSVSDIKTVISKRGLENGTVFPLPEDSKSWSHLYEDSNGKVVKVRMTPLAQQRAAKEISEGVTSSVKVLIDTGFPQEAEELMKRYSKSIDPVNESKLIKTFKTADDKSKANDFMNSVQDLSSEEQLRKIENIRDTDLKTETLKIKESNDARLDSQRKRKVKRNYDRLGSRVLDKMNSDSPYNGISDLENDPMYKETWDNLDVKSKEAITQMVKSPKTTATGAETRVQNLLFGETEAEIETTTPEEFNALLTGLSDKDRRRYTGLYNGIRIESASEKRAVYKRSGALLMDRMLADELIERNKFGKLDPEDEIELINARGDLMDHLDKFGTNLDDKQLNDFVKEYSQSLVKDRAFNPQPRRKIVKRETDNVDMTPRQRINFKKDFREEFGYLPRNNDEEFKSFVREKVK